MALTKLNNYSLPDNAVTSAKLGVDVIVADDLAAYSVTVSEITDGVITEAKLNIDNTPTNDHVLTAKSSAAGGLTWAAAGGGITNINTWRTHTNSTATQDPITANWEQDDTAGAVLLGSAMTQSSGIFTFPSTGIWRIDANTTWSATNTIVRYVQTAIKTTIDNSTWKYGAIGTGNIYGGTNVTYNAGAYCACYFDVTDTSNCKVAIGAYEPSVNASTPVSYTHLRAHET